MNSDNSHIHKARLSFTFVLTFNLENVKIMEVRATRKLSELKAEFHDQFPFLKIEFFKVPHHEQEPTAKKAMIKADHTVSEISETEKEGEIVLSGDMTVNELESLFRDEYGINVQVFRRSGNVWLETSSTDEMTLDEQNELGMEKATPPEQADVTDIDYD